MSQSALFLADFRTALPSRPIFCHQEFLDKLSARNNEPSGKRAALLLQRMAVDIARLHYKGTSGVNRGWRRSRLGGSSGSHFYAWWTTVGSPVLERAGSGALPESVFVRDIRHHDDHSPLACGDPSADYLPLTVQDLRSTEYAPEPFTQAQHRFARSRGPVRILRGHPGSGKTTALLHAADSSMAERVLYLTFSADLAALARDYFDRFCSADRTFTVLTWSAFLGQLLNWKGKGTDPSECRARFRRDLGNHKASLGAWGAHLDSLYDEMHAHLVGAAVPEDSGRFVKAERVHLPERAYLAQRNRFLPNADAVIEAVRRLERADSSPLSDRYFPELALAWRAAQVLSPSPHSVKPAFLDFGCIAVDEIQDLTPLEAFVVMALARGQKLPHVPLLLAGDEAQTVRPTDFEWAWLNDMLHTTVGHPQEFRLTANLRSPRRIAELVNRAWDLYDHLEKRDRPSGSGTAEIDDDSPDQILYAALPASELKPLLMELSQREGLALIAFDKSTLPPEALPWVLSPVEAKGLDFHSVCIVNGGAVVHRIVTNSDRSRGALSTRLDIDAIRVAVSRPSERLIWVDAAPDSATVREVGELLRPISGSLHPMSVEALRTSLAEEDLDVEERIQRCRLDAIQLTPVKPDLAWSRAHQAVALLGAVNDINRVADADVRASAHLTLCEVCFRLAFHRKALSPELGRPNLYDQATAAARAARNNPLANAIMSIGALENSVMPEKLNRIAAVTQMIAEAAKEDCLPSWLKVEITPRAETWLDELDRNFSAGDNPLIAQRILPPFFDALGFPDAAARKGRLAQRAVQVLMKARKFAQALTILESLPTGDPLLIAACHEETGAFGAAARIYLELGDREKALKCYRCVPDFAATLKLVGQMEGHAAKASLEWLAELEALLAKRPDNFNKVMTVPEKKLLTDLLERGLGVQRKVPVKKPAVKKAPGDKPPIRKSAVKKTAVKKESPAAPKAVMPRKRVPRRFPDRDNPWF